MKRALIISELAAGGVERVNMLLAKGLSTEFEIYILSVKGIGKEYINDIKYISIDAESGKKAFFKIIRIIKNLAPDFIITCNHTDTVCSLIYSKFINPNAKSIFVAHSVYSSMFTYKSKVKLLFQHYLPKILGIYGKCDAVIYVSNGVKDDFKKLYHVKEEKEHVIYNPVLDVIPLEPIQDKKLSNPVKLVSVGRLDIEKRQNILIDAIKELNDNGCLTELYLYGSGCLKEKLIRQSENLNIKDKVHFMGFSTSIINELLNYDIFVLASEFESFGNVIVEAMAAGLPVVVMDCPVGPREILDGGKLGMLVPNNDLNAFLTSIRETIKQYPYEYIKKAYLASLEFELSKVCKKYCEIMNSL